MVTASAGFARALAGVSRPALLPLLGVILLAWTTSPSAQSGGGGGDGGALRHRARLSEDLTRRLGRGDFAPSTVILTGSQTRVDTIAARHGLRIRKRLETGAVLEVPAYRLAAVAEDPDVDQLSGNHPVSAQMNVTLQAIGADQVHAGNPVAQIPGLTGEGVGIAIIDSGIAPMPQFRGRIVASRDFTDDRGRGLDEHGHGTHVAGIAAAAGAHPFDDTRGVAPGAHLISLKVLDAEGRGYAADVIQAIDWAVANRRRFRIKVINLSLGGPVLQAAADDPICQAVERAYRAGIVVVASAGNFGKDADGRSVYGGITVPGNSPFAITVGALNTKGTPWRSDDELASYSSKGPTRYDHLIKPDLVAPGNRIRGLAAPGSTLVRQHPELLVREGGEAALELSGTSMAAPVVTAAAALLIEMRARLSVGEMRILLQYPAEPIREAGLLGAGAGALDLVGARNLLTNSGDQAAGVGASHGEFVFGALTFWQAEDIVIDGENILWGSGKNILWGSGRNILWGSGENVLWASAENILSGSAGNILWGSSKNILWGSAGNILWGSGENILSGNAGNILWGSGGNILWGSSENILWGNGTNILWGSAVGD